MADLAPCYLAVVRRRCSPDVEAWWDSVSNMAPSASPRAALSSSYSKAARMLGHAPLKLESHEVAVGELRRLLSFQERPLHEVGRAALLLLAMSVLPQDEHVACVDELFVRGDNAEREALLRTLPLLPDAARFLSTAGEACRTNVRTVFEAIACENPYPGLYFPESSFNQLIMKALFLGVPVRRIVGLPDRVTPALRRMAGDYARERIAAGRPVNEDAGWVQTL